MEGFVDYPRTERDAILLGRAANYIAVNNLSTTNVIAISSPLNPDSAGIKFFQIINKFYYTTLKMYEWSLQAVQSYSSELIGFWFARTSGIERVNALFKVNVIRLSYIRLPNGPRLMFYYAKLTHEHSNWHSHEVDSK